MAQRRERFGRLVQVRLGRTLGDDVLAAVLRTVRLRQKQESRKLSPVIQIPRSDRRPGIKPIPPFASSTYASFATCPPSCPFLHDPETGKRRGCYASAHVSQRSATERLDSAAMDIPPDIRQELLALAELWVVATTHLWVPQDGHEEGGRDLRLHVSGDATIPFAVDCLAEAALEWQAGRGGQVWTYTHAWRRIPRKSWGLVSVIASVETGEDIMAARERGYAAAIVVTEFPDGRRPFSLPDAPSITIIPCLAEAGVISPRTSMPLTCVECRLCLDDAHLYENNLAIAFRAHGVDRVAVHASLERVRNGGGGHGRGA